MWPAGRADEARPVDAIVVLGAAQYDGRPSPQLAPGSTTPSSCTSAGCRRVVFVTGGKQPLDRFTEAQRDGPLPGGRGVPAAAILREDQGRTSWESLTAVADQLTADGPALACCWCRTRTTPQRIKGMADGAGPRRLRVAHPHQPGHAASRRSATC